MRVALWPSKGRKNLRCLFNSTVVCAMVAMLSPVSSADQARSCSTNGTPTQVTIDFFGCGENEDDPAAGFWPWFDPSGATNMNSESVKNVCNLTLVLKPTVLLPTTPPKPVNNGSANRTNNGDAPEQASTTVPNQPKPNQAKTGAGFLVTISALARDEDGNGNNTARIDSNNAGNSQGQSKIAPSRVALGSFFFPMDSFGTASGSAAAVKASFNANSGLSRLMQNQQVSRGNTSLSAGVLNQWQAFTGTCGIHFLDAVLEYWQQSPENNNPTMDWTWVKYELPTQQTQEPVQNSNTPTLGRCEMDRFRVPFGVACPASSPGVNILQVQPQDYTRFPNDKVFSAIDGKTVEDLMKASMSLEAQSIGSNLANAHMQMGQCKSEPSSTTPPSKLSPEAQMSSCLNGAGPSGKSVFSGSSLVELVRILRPDGSATQPMDPTKFPSMPLTSGISSPMEKPIAYASKLTDLEMSAVVSSAFSAPSEVMQDPIGRYLTVKNAAQEYEELATLRVQLPKVYPSHTVSIGNMAANWQRGPLKVLFSDPQPISIPRTHSTPLRAIAVHLRRVDGITLRKMRSNMQLFGSDGLPPGWEDFMPADSLLSVIEPPQPKGGVNSSAVEVDLSKLYIGTADICGPAFLIFKFYPDGFTSTAGSSDSARIPIWVECDFESARERKATPLLTQPPPLGQVCSATPHAWTHGSSALLASQHPDFHSAAAFFQYEATSHSFQPLDPNEVDLIMAGPPPGWHLLKNSGALHIAAKSLAARMQGDRNCPSVETFVKNRNFLLKPLGDVLKVISNLVNDLLSQPDDKLLQKMSSIKQNSFTAAAVKEELKNIETFILAGQAIIGSSSSMTDLWKSLAQIIFWIPDKTPDFEHSRDQFGGPNAPAPNMPVMSPPTPIPSTSALPEKIVDWMNNWSGQPKFGSGPITPRIFSNIPLTPNPTTPSTYPLSEKFSNGMSKGIEASQPFGHSSSNPFNAFTPPTAKPFSIAPEFGNWFKGTWDKTGLHTFGKVEPKTDCFSPLVASHEPSQPTTERSWRTKLSTFLHCITEMAGRDADAIMSPLASIMSLVQGTKPLPGMSATGQAAVRAAMEMLMEGSGPQILEVLLDSMMPTGMPPLGVSPGPKPVTTIGDTLLQLMVNANVSQHLDLMERMILMAIFNGDLEQLAYGQQLILNEDWKDHGNESSNILTEFLQDQLCLYQASSMLAYLDSKSMGVTMNATGKYGEIPRARITGIHSPMTHVLNNGAPIPLDPLVPETAIFWTPDGKGGLAKGSFNIITGQFYLTTVMACHGGCDRPCLPDRLWGPNPSSSTTPKPQVDPYFDIHGQQNGPSSAPARNGGGAPPMDTAHHA